MVVLQPTTEKVSTINLHETMDKSLHPSVTGKSSDVCSHQRVLALCVYAGAVTAALVVIITLGISYQNQTREICNKQLERQISPTQAPDDGDNDATTNHVRVRTEAGVEEDTLTVSPDGRYETVLSQAVNSTRNIITVVDLHQGLTGVYHPVSDECYLLGGVSSSSERGVEAKEDGEVEFAADDETNYDVLYDSPVRDKSLLPGQLSDICQHKQTYWMQKQTEEHQRQKRGCYWFRFCYWYRYGWYYYVRCYYRVYCYG